MNMSGDDRQKRLFFKYTRAGVELTQSEVLEIKAGRKKLRADMKAAGIYNSKDFELTASSLGLYFDKKNFRGLLLWLLHGRALWALLGAGAALMLALYAISKVTDMRGHFTINLTDEMFEEGFELSETVGFEKTSARLFGLPVEDAPCISIGDLPAGLNDVDGSHNGRAYFAHTFYLAKRGPGTVDYRYALRINSESLDSSEAIWVILYENGTPVLYAHANGETGGAECLPPEGATRGGKPLAYAKDDIPFIEEFAPDQYERVEGKNDYGYRLIPTPFADDLTVTDRLVEDIGEDEVHKYTVVIWLEGDDPDCTDALIGGHVGMHMDFELIDE